ncbi:hypothetical protein CAPTEDRAFT_197542 [Capitella teleta]|uniref:RING-type domain-containing protein n=1 Tax=Capitella teleta TaxID=283909 RepID=R7UXT4_CAPTE|nr:hypothetical protein CAPTEDRAFT_197542 [Capitella teleta]|eukprot:ELU08221.1 hypothetical protein CAPTEDRAFT_197542 [Capitella teleta]
MALREKEDFECTLCYRILFLPVTTPCGHVFCRHCLDRCLDHTTVCPLCKTSLSEYLAERRQAVTEAIVEIIQAYFPQDFAERQQQHEQDLAELSRMGAGDQQEVPIFVCTLSFPKMVCPLHIFEPRYRLMIRQCMEAGTRQFGMCVSLQEGDSFSEYGCMLEIRDVQYFPDGRSVVDTVGGRRFKVISRGMRNGYDTAKVELLSDYIDETPEALTALQKLHNSVRQDSEKWMDMLPSGHKAKIQQHMGPLPNMEVNPLSLTDGPAWLWWLISVLPLDPKAKLSILAMCSLKDRLNACKRVLQYVMRKCKSK